MQMVIMGTTSTAARRYLTRAEVARLFEVSPATVARWTREGKLPFVLTLGGQRRYPRHQIIDLIRPTTMPGCDRVRSAGADPDLAGPVIPNPTRHLERSTP